MSLVLDVKVGDSVSIDSDRVIMTVLEKSGQRARLSFNADPDVKVQRVARRPTTGAAQARMGLSLMGG